MGRRAASTIARRARSATSPNWTGKEDDAFHSARAGPRRRYAPKGWRAVGATKEQSLYADRCAIRSRKIARRATRRAYPHHWEPSSSAMSTSGIGEARGVARTTGVLRGRRAFQPNGWMMTRSRGYDDVSRFVGLRMVCVPTGRSAVGGQTGSRMDIRRWECARCHDVSFLVP